jgi:drug/metabolite transporter (DMT)-like permease
MDENTLKTYAAAVMAMLLLSAGQVLLKVLASKLLSNGLVTAAWRQDAATLAWLIAGVVAIYLIVIVLWLYVLKSLDLSRAFAFASLAFIFVPAFSYYFLDEKITGGMLGGAILIIGGIILAANF